MAAKKAAPPPRASRGAGWATPPAPEPEPAAPPPSVNGKAQDLHGAAMAAAAEAGAHYLSNQPPPQAIIPGRVVALNRAGQPVQRAAAETGVDRFFVPPHIIPPGWSWEWKRESVRGQADPYYISQLKQVAWEPVRYESYPGIFAPEFDEQGKRWSGPVRREGLILMERPLALTIEARNEENAKAKRKANDARTQYTTLNAQGAQTVDIDLEARRASYIRQQVEPATMPPPMPGPKVD